MKAIDLFCGCGGLSLGLKNSGIEMVLSVEIDKWAADTYDFNHPNSNLIRKDIREIPVEFWTKYRGDIDIIVGGPPCQGFSVSGKRQKGERIESTELLREFMNVVGTVKPSYFLLENVKGLKTGKMKSGSSATGFIKKESEKLGYEITFKEFQIADYGLPSIRSRIFAFGIKNGIKKFELNPEPTHSSTGQNGKPRWIGCLSAISDLPQIKARGGTDDKQNYDSKPMNEYQKLMREDSEYVLNHEAMKHTDKIIQRFEKIQQGESSYKIFEGEEKVTIYKSNNQRLISDEPSKCITANFQSNFIHPLLHRNLTSREAARLMSFPDNYAFKGKRTLPSSGVLQRSGRKNQDFLSQYNQIGNSVPPLFAEVLGNFILSQT